MSSVIRQGRRRPVPSLSQAVPQSSRPQLRHCSAHLGARCWPMAQAARLTVLPPGLFPDFLQTKWGGDVMAPIVSVADGN